MIRSMTGTMGQVWVLVAFLALIGWRGGAAAHSLPLEQCDFYFQGHKDTVPMLDVLVTRNLTTSPPILTKFETEVVAAEISTDCAFLPDPSMAFEKRSCSGHFHVRNHHLSGRFRNEEFSTLEALRFHQVLMALESLRLEDGTELDQNDTNSQFPHPRRCVTFLTTPAVVPHYNTDRALPDGDVITKVVELVPKMLDNMHRKKLNKIRESARQLGHDISLLGQDMANFP
ncbi:uncharacterized protein [Physcomitrium patens]|uniref:Uncharacterized protein n=1 Tax=Physcomitrium patens TaxID=3218 RepID=A0A2K1KHA5_PHYPA|nr:uncharacterized protein LOC112283198 [Physcomitrium patens]PNR53157.1 hypothetical protein PHYPA_009532 [Physcomitrium patens]|eukprot:XP_024377390.1 uncharacterized protein LOC112283198 [Physcomitrella patens]